MNVYETIRKAFSKKKHKQFTVTKIWYVKAKNPKDAIKVADLTEHNILEVVLNGKKCYDEQNGEYDKSKREVS